MIPTSELITKLLSVFELDVVVLRFPESWYDTGEKIRRLSWKSRMFYIVDKDPSSEIMFGGLVKNDKIPALISANNYLQ